MKKLMISLFVASFISSPTASAESLCSLTVGKNISTPEKCHAAGMDGFKQIKDVNANMCSNNKGVPLNGGRCEKSIETIKESYGKIDKQMSDGCQQIPKIYEQCAACSGPNSKGQLGCQDFAKKLYDGYVDFNKKRLADIKSIRSELKKLDRMGLDVAKEYAENLKENENLVSSPATANSPANSAQEIGASTPAGAVTAHQGMSSGQAMQMIEKFSSISGGEGTEEADSIQSPLIREQVKTSLTARSLDESVAKYEQSITANDMAAQNNSNTLNQNNGKLGADPKSSNAAKAAQAASGAAGAAGGGGIPVSQNNSGSENSAIGASNQKNLNTAIAGNDGLGGSANRSNDFKSGATEGGSQSETGIASSGGKSLKESLSASLAARLNGTSTSMMGAAPTKASSANGGAAGGSVKLDAKGKPISAEVQKIAASVGSADLGGGSGMNFNSSEIKGSIDDLLGSDSSAQEAVFGDMAGGVGGAGNYRGLASEQGSNVIQSEESAALFDRVRECHVRSQKTGNVLYGFAARASQKQ